MNTQEHELWDRAQEQILGTLTVPQVLATPGVVELVTEHYNNDIHEVWEGLKDEAN